MMTFLGALLGLIGSAFPELIRIYKDGKDKVHELAILDRQAEMQKQGMVQRTEMIGALADMGETQALYATYQSGVSWVDALNGSVRPVLAYAFFLLYAYSKYVQAVHMPWLMWDDDDKAIFAGIISFYFGQRAMHKWLKPTK